MQTQKNAGSKIKLNEWEAYLDWKLETSKRNTDKFKKMINKKFYKLSLN